MKEDGVFLIKKDDVDFLYFDNLIQNPKAINLHLAAFNRPAWAFHLMTDYQVQKLVRNNNNLIHTGFLTELQKPINWKKLNPQYRQAIQVIESTKINVQGFNNRFVDLLPVGGGQAALTRNQYYRSNKLFTKNINIFNNLTLIENINPTHNINFISGPLSVTDELLLGNKPILILYQIYFLYAIGF